MHLIYQRSKSVLQLIVRIVGWICFFLFLFLLIMGGDNIDIISILVIVSTISQILILLFNRSVYNSGMLMIFYAYTVLVHNGFVIANFIDRSYSTFQSYLSMLFLCNPYYPKAIVIANIVIWFFVFSAEISTGKLYEYNKSLDYQIKTDEGNKWADIVGVLLLLYGTVYLGYLIFSNGLWLAGYVSSLSITENLPIYSHIVVITSLSIAIIMAVGTRKGVRIGLILFAINSILHFSIGNRGEVMYAAVICFALYSIRYKNIKLKHVIVAGIVAVILIPLVRISREMKLDIYTLNPFASFLDVLCEEGLEISPFTYITQYLGDGNGHVWGMTYISNFQDFLMRRIGSEGTLLQEQYVIKSIMPYDGMGFTMIAELYYNFGIIGAGVVYMLFAQIIKKWDMKIYSNELCDAKKMFVAMLMVEMINLTRNDSSTLPLYLSWSLILLLLCRFFGKRKTTEIAEEM